MSIISFLARLLGYEYDDRPVGWGVESRVNDWSVPDMRRTYVKGVGWVDWDANTQVLNKKTGVVSDAWTCAEEKYRNNGGSDTWCDQHDNATQHSPGWKPHTWGKTWATRDWKAGRKR